MSLLDSHFVFFRLMPSSAFINYTHHDMMRQYVTAAKHPRKVGKHRDINADKHLSRRIEARMLQRKGSESASEKSTALRGETAM